MKTCKFFFILLAGLSLSVSSCEKDGEDEVRGKVEYDGTTYIINYHIYEDLYFPSDGGEPLRMQRFTLYSKPKNSNSVCAMNVPLDDVFADMDIAINDDIKAAFACQSKTYNNNGKMYIYPPDGGYPEATLITGGHYNWKVAGKTGRLEFRLEFEDGLSAEGYADVPMSIFK